MPIDPMTLREIVTGDIEERLAYQTLRCLRAIGGTIVVPAGQNKELAINISNEGDFLCDRIAGRIIPSDGATFYGMLMQVYDNNKTQLVEQVSADLVLTPGYGFAITTRQEFKHLFERATTIRVLLTNTSAVDQTFNIAFVGERLK